MALHVVLVFIHEEIPPVNQLQVRLKVKVHASTSSQYVTMHVHVELKLPPKLKFASQNCCERETS